VASHWILKPLLVNGLQSWRIALDLGSSAFKFSILQRFIFFSLMLSYPESKKLFGNSTPNQYKFFVSELYVELYVKAWLISNLLKNR
jgi:hypothetical protein